MRRAAAAAAAPWRRPTGIILARLADLAVTAFARLARIDGIALARRSGFAVIVFAAGAFAGCGEDSSPEPPARAATAPARAGLSAEVPGEGSLTAVVRRPKVLWSRPGGGRRLAGMPRMTKFDSPRVVSVVARRGQWLRVLAPELPNHRTGWIDGRRGVRLFRVPWSLEASLSRRTLTVRRLGNVVTRVPIAIGRPGAPTPRGRFAVTDRLTTNGDTGPYGCCILALTGHQPNTPQGWGGGDRLAIHATPAEQTIGHAASLGCLRATNGAMRRLMRLIPLGTPVRIRR